MKRVIAMCLGLAIVFMMAEISLADQKKVQVAIIIADQELNESMITRIIKQNSEITDGTNVTTSNGSLESFRQDPDAMSMVTIALYDKKHKTNFISHMYTTLIGKIDSIEYIMIKLYDTERGKAQ